MQQVPRYTEGANPGIREYSIADFAELIPETKEQQELRRKLSNQVLNEFVRLNIDSSNWEYITYSQLGVMKLSDCESLFALNEFVNWLKRLVSNAI